MENERSRYLHEYSKYADTLAIISRDTFVRVCVVCLGKGVDEYTLRTSTFVH